MVTSVVVAVVGDPSTGKSSLIVSVATDTFSSTVPPVLPPTRLPRDFYPDKVPLTIIDTSSRPEDKGKVDATCRKADAIILTYACDRPKTLERLSTYWLPELRRLGVRVPVIIVGCKLDLRSSLQQSLEEIMTPIMQDFREIETCIECSALKQVQVADTFYYAQKAVLHPTAPLFDQDSQTLKPHCVRALKRIFILCDHDRDGALSDEELNDFQVKCFNAPLQPSEVEGVKKVVSEKLPEGVNDRGLTLSGFLSLHALFIERGRLETTWTVLRKFGYDDEVKLRDDMLQTPSFKRSSDQNVELTDKALDFLRTTFSVHDLDKDGSLSLQEVDDLFSTAPSSPWEESIYRDSCEKNVRGGLTLNGFLAQWVLMTLLDPVKSLSYFIYLNYPGDVSTAFQISRRRRIDRKKQCTQRNVTNCFMFGPDMAGKTTLIRASIGRPYVETYIHTLEDQYSAHIVESTGGAEKTLILREVPFDSISTFRSNKDSLAQCDVAIFIYDSSDEASWKEALELLLEVAAHGEETGFGVPCLLVAAKDDLGPNAAAVSDSARVCQEMGMEAPISVSVKLGDTSNVFRRIVDAAQRPHLSIPVTEAGKSYQHYKQIFGRSIMILSVGAAVAVVGIAAYRLYCARRHASN